MTVAARPITAALLALLTLLPALSARSGFQGFTLPRHAGGKEAWNAFKDAYVTADGRVIDDANGGISHSEGQGYGMLLAAEYRDLSTFSVLWKWTRENLAVREDGLFAWKWDPSRPASPITDPNNATDGDLLIAWALQRAGEMWRNDRHLEDAKRIARQVRLRMVVDSPLGPLLLPGGGGFRRPEGVIVNPSYWVFPAFLDLRRIDPSHVWNDLFLSGLRIVRDARFSDWDLPPDWLLVRANGELELPSGFDPVFGYNAVRVPLYLYWAGVADEDLYEPFIRWATHSESVFQVPDQVNLETGKEGEYTLIPGMVAVYHLIDPDKIPNAGPPSASFTSYYSACLDLLAAAARKEHQRYSELPRP